VSVLARYLADDDVGWRPAAACRGKDPRLFFEAALEPTARRVCAACPVRDDCLDEAIVERREGFWGGTNDHERARIIEQRARVAERPRRKRAVPPGHLYAVLEQLAQHPGRWARIISYPSSHSAGAIASLLRNGHKPTPPGRWEFEGRVNDARGSDLYARYLGASLDQEHAS
jgi:WhiB family redox-sensing transcriptional regulator